MSVIVPSSHTGIGAWVNSKMHTNILYNIINCHARVSHQHRVLKEKSEQLLYLYWYSYVVYFVCDSASEFGAMGSTLLPFWGFPALTCFLFF